MQFFMKEKTLRIGLGGAISVDGWLCMPQPSPTVTLGFRAGIIFLIWIAYHVPRSAELPVLRTS